VFLKKIQNDIFGTYIYPLDDGKIKQKLPNKYYQQDFTAYSILPYLYVSFIIFFKYIYDEKILLKMFSNYINPHLGQLLANEPTVLKAV
jgi:hypothetical protein